MVHSKIGAWLFQTGALAWEEVQLGGSLHPRAVNSAGLERRERMQRS
jgi:hypothetical protein